MSGWAWVKDGRYPRGLIALHVATLAAMLAVVMLLSGCREQPTFVTEQGIPVFDETGTATEVQFNCALRIVFANSYGLAWAVVDDYTDINVTGESLGWRNGRKVIECYNEGDIFAVAGPDLLPLLAHGMGHAIQWSAEETIDDNHLDERFFGSPASMEKVAGAMIREACP